MGFSSKMLDFLPDTLEAAVRVQQPDRRWLGVLSSCVTLIVCSVMTDGWV